MRLDNVLTVIAVAAAVYALYLASRGAPASGLVYAASSGVAGPAGAPFTYNGIPLGYDSAGGPAYG